MAKAKPKGTAVVAHKSSTALVSMKEMQEAIAREVTEIATRTGSPGGDQIRVTQDKKFRLPDGTEHPGPLHVVIVDFATHRNFYDRPFDRNNPTPPACFAITRGKPTEMAPSKDVPDRQSDACSSCPNNEFGSAGDGKACKESRLLAVIPDDADATTELALLGVSPTGLKPFDSYVRTLAASMNTSPIAVVTEVSFDPNVTYASLRFGNPQPCPQDLLATAFALREAAKTRLLSEPDTSQYQPPGRAPARGPARKPATARR